MTNKKPFVKINIEDLEYAKEFFDNIADYSIWLYAITEYYQGNEVTIKKKIVKKYFDNYKKTMNIVIEAKEFGKQGALKRIEKQQVNIDTLEDPLKDTLKETLAVNNKVLNIKNNIEERKLKFADALKPFLDEYGRDMLNDFYFYWTEHGENDKKLRFEKEKTFGISQRLRTWFSRNPKQYQKEGISPEELKAIKLGFLKPKQ
jgi:hypothetical protein